MGGAGSDKRIDVIATAIRAGMDATDLTELDLAYAPPYASAKDPVNMAGYLIENILEGRVEQVGWSEALELTAREHGSEASPVLLDTRTADEVARGSVEGALHVPLDELRERLDELPGGRRLLVFCQSGLRSYVACRILTQHGFSCANVSGGYGFLEQTLRDGALPPSGTGPCGRQV